jgi:serine/threonine protein kinase
MFQNASPVAIDLIKKMLTIDPSKRISLEGALSHPFLKALHHPKFEPTTSLIGPYDFDWELFDIKRGEFKVLIYEESRLYNEKKAKDQY